MPRHEPPKRSPVSPGLPEPAGPAWGRRELLRAVSIGLAASALPLVAARLAHADTGPVPSPAGLWQASPSGLCAAFAAQYCG